MGSNRLRYIICSYIATIYVYVCVTIRNSQSYLIRHSCNVSGRVDDFKSVKKHVSVCLPKTSPCMSLQVYTSLASYTGNDKNMAGLKFSELGKLLP